ncbi:MAG: hypothetical protein JNK67_01210 [Alphaproteobacteria bacterium]|nr:hypothetical protein [Alphaproteobacteria bacterium]
MDAPGLSDDRLVEILLGAVALACLVLGARRIATPGRRVGGIALVALGILLGAVLYVFATFTMRMF